MSCRPSESQAPSCPSTNTPTKPVGIVTVTRHALLPSSRETTFGFCDVPTCDVVYVGADGTLIRKDQLRTRVGVKESEEPIPICYCFHFTAHQVAEDYRSHGRSTIRPYIQEQVRAGRCRCEMTNPSGRCCLGDVGRVIAGSVRGSSAQA